MRKVLFATVFLAALVAFSGRPAYARPNVLARDGKTKYRIVVPGEADVSTKAVAEDLAGILEEIAGVAFPVVTDGSAPGAREIVVGGTNARLAALDLAGMTEGFTRGEYEIRSVGAHLVIAGGPPRGTINGMYGFLQDHLGCRWFTPGCSRVPKERRLRIGEIRDRQGPAFASRRIGDPLAFDAGWVARNRLNECTGGGGSAGVMMVMSDPRVQTVSNYFTTHAMGGVPKSLYDGHPEFFAWIDGKRSRDRKTFCVTNPGFVEYMGKRLTRILRFRGADQGPRIAGLAHADTGAHCGCDACRKSYDRVGTTGTYMEFDGKVAEIVTRTYPDAIIHTLAYGFTFDPPPMKVHPNVRVTWCPITACSAHGLDQCAPNKDRDFVPKLAAWREQVTILGVWYYHHQYDLLMPHMKMHATGRDLRTFQRIGVDRIFVENNTGANIRRNPAFDGDKLLPAYGEPEKQGYFTIPFELVHLRSYILCRLLWDPQLDWKQLVREFCDTYYGAAAGELAQYVLTVESGDSYERSLGGYRSYPGLHFDNGISPLIKRPVMEAMDALLERAEGKVRNDRRRLRRVEMVRSSLDLGILCFSALDHPLRQKAFDRFFALMEELDLRMLYATGVTRQRMTIPEFKKFMSTPEKIAIPGMEPVGANLLRNSGFEKEIHADGIPDHWRADGSYLPEAYVVDPAGVTRDASKTHSGTWSVRLTKTPAENAIVSLRQRFDATPGGRYRAKTHYRADVKKGAVIMMFTEFGRDGTWLTHAGRAVAVKQTGDTWLELTAETKAGTDTAQLMIEILFYDDWSEGVVWLDDFECAKIGDG